MFDGGDNVAAVTSHCFSGAWRLTTGGVHPLVAVNPESA